MGDAYHVVRFDGAVQRREPGLRLAHLTVHVGVDFGEHLGYPQQAQPASRVQGRLAAKKKKGCVCVCVGG